MDDLNEVEAMVKEDLDAELAPSVYHFHPEAYEKLDWSRMLREMKVSPEELKDIAAKITVVRKQFLERALLLE